MILTKLTELRLPPCGEHVTRKFRTYAEHSAPLFGGIQHSLVPAGNQCIGCGRFEKARATPGGYRRIGRASDKPRITRLEQGPRRQKPNRSCAHGNGAASGECS